jgi:hypothetical protein
LRTLSTAGSYADGSRHGTRITISVLSHDWSEAQRAEDLASEIWQLRSPEPSSAIRSDEQFEISLSSDIPDVQNKFRERLLAPLDIWHALVHGELVPPRIHGGPAELAVNIRFRDQSASEHQRFMLPECHLNQLRFEIRVYSLHGKQPAGIAVSNARDNVQTHGGVKIYDSGFRLPYYGLEHDWLDIEVDHSHRLSQSKILPGTFHVPDGLSNLPTQTRLLGFVFVNTGHEASAAKRNLQAERRNEYLQIQVTRDRLLDNLAYQDLKKCVRLALDWYAMRETIRRLKEVEHEVARLPRRDEQIESVAQILKKHAPSLPKRKAETIKRELEAVIYHEAASQELLGQNVNLLGALATAGMLALAFEHEIARQLTVLERLSERLKSSGKIAAELSNELARWIRRVRQTRTIFTSLSDEESRRKRQHFIAKSSIEQFVQQAQPFLSGIEVSVDDVDEELRLPAGTFAEWSALFQNIFCQRGQCDDRQETSRDRDIFADVRQAKYAPDSRHWNGSGPGRRRKAVRTI